eukprot:363220-Chlamydomonas_euryale.AAC.3
MGGEGLQASSMKSCKSSEVLEGQVFAEGEGDVGAGREGQPAMGGSGLPSEGHGGAEDRATTTSIRGAAASQSAGAPLMAMVTWDIVCVEEDEGRQGSLHSISEYSCALHTSFSTSRLPRHCGALCVGRTAGTIPEGRPRSTHLVVFHEQVDLLVANDPSDGELFTSAAPARA